MHPFKKSWTPVANNSKVAVVVCNFGLHIPVSSSLPQSSVDKVKKISGSNKDTNEDDGLLITLADEKDAINGATYHDRCLGMLPIVVGDLVHLIEEENQSGWVRGYKMSHPKDVGIFPKSHVRVKHTSPPSKETRSFGDIEWDMGSGICSVLLEWDEILQRLFVIRDETRFAQLEKLMEHLIDLRTQLMSGLLNTQQSRELKSKISSKINFGNRMLGLDMVPWESSGGDMVDINKKGIVHIFLRHVDTTQRYMSPGDVPKMEGLRSQVEHRKNGRRLMNHHIQVTFRLEKSSSMIVGSEDLDLYFSLYSPKTGRYVSERVLVNKSLTRTRNRSGEKATGFSVQQSPFKRDMVFMDVGTLDECRELHLVCHVYRMGRMVAPSSTLSSPGSFVAYDARKSTLLLSPGAIYKRPHAAGVVNINKLVTRPVGSSADFDLKLHVCDDKDFHQLHELIMKKSNSSAKYNPLITTNISSFHDDTSLMGVGSGVSGGGDVSVSLKFMVGEAQSLRRENSSLKNLIEVRRLGFPNVIMPGDVRNDLYLTIDRGVFERGGKAAARNIEVRACVVDKDGVTVENCIYGCASESTVGATYIHSTVLYHNNSPVWADTLRLQVPLEKFYHAHVRLEYRHCSAKDKGDKKLLGFSFVHLMEEDETTIKDGNHTLCFYKCEDAGKIVSPSAYLALPSKVIHLAPPDNSSGSSSVTLSHGFVRSSKESITVTTKLCSTKLTQNVDLMSLLNWKSMDRKSIPETLGKIMKLDGEEVVKFLQDVLDALFGMFSTEDGNSTEHSGQVFHVLVSIISCLEDPKFEHFKPVMDAYINGHFAAALVYKGLLSCVRHCCDLVPQTERQEPIQKCFKSLEYIAKFVIQSRKLFSQATGSGSAVGGTMGSLGSEAHDSFVVDIHLVFNSINKMLSSSNHNDTIIPTLVVFLDHIVSTYPHFLEVLTPLDLSKLTSLMLDSLPRESCPHPLVRAKIRAIRACIKSPVFTSGVAEARALILPTFCSHLKVCLVDRQEIFLCGEAIGDLVTFLHENRNNCKLENGGWSSDDMKRDIQTLSEVLLDPLINALLLIDREKMSITMGTLVSCLMGLLEIMDENNFLKLWENFGCPQERSRVKQFLLQTFMLFHDLLDAEVFPSDWSVVRMAVTKVMLKTMQELAKPLLVYFKDKNSNIGDDDKEAFDNQLWTGFFTLAILFVNQKCLQLEDRELVSDSKRHRILQQHGDMRLQMTYQIMSLWAHLGHLQHNFVPGMVGPFLDLTLVAEDELRRTTIPIFYDLLQCEFQQKSSFKQVETELIDKLDILVSENKGDHEYRQLFDAILMENLATRDPVWRENGTQFVTSVSKLLERLLDYRTVIQGDASEGKTGSGVKSSLDQRMSCTVNLLNFYGSSCESKQRRQEMYLRYVYKLHDLHLQNNPTPNYTEAGFTLKLHSDLLQWTNRTLHADLRFPTQKEWQRKEELYLKIIDYFEKGKQWEHALPLCKELAKVYEEKVFDFDKLSSVLRRQATLFDRVLSKSEENLRLDPEYFRVGFYGKGFPLFLRNKEFIYRGLDWEKISTFTQRICAEFPASQLLSSNTPPDERTRESEAQFVQICCVKPVPNLIVVQKQQGAMEGYTVPDQIRSFYLTNDVQSFQYDRPFHKGARDKDNEFKTLWVERSTYMTTSQLPGVLRWFEVEKVAVDEITPIDHACETVAAKNAELRHLAAVAESSGSPSSGYGNKTDNSGSVRKLTQTLQGVIDAAVNGGVSKYSNAFFSGSYVDNENNDLGKVNRLHNLLMEQVNVLESALSTHERVASAEIRPLHDHLAERFSKGMKASLLNQHHLLKLTTNLSSPGTPHHNNNKAGPTGSAQRKSKIVNTPLPPLPPQQHPHHQDFVDGNNYYSAMTSLSSTSSSASDGHAADRIIPIAVEENAVYHRPTSNQASSNKSTNNLMTASCPNSQALLRANNHITTPSRYSSQRALQHLIPGQGSRQLVGGDGHLVYGNHSSGGCGGGGSGGMALAVNLASVQRCSNMSSSSSTTSSTTSGSCGSTVSDIAPVPATPPRPPSGVSGVTASLLRSKKQQAAAPPMSGGVNHYGTCTGGGSNSNVGSGGGSHQRDSGHASIGSSEDLAPAPPLPPRYSMVSSGSSNCASKGSPSRNVVNNRTSLYHDGSSTSSTSTLNLRMSNDLRDEDSVSQTSSQLVHQPSSLIPPPIPPKASAAASVGAGSNSGRPSVNPNYELVNSAPVASGEEDDLVLYIDDTSSAIIASP